MAHAKTPFDCALRRYAAANVTCILTSTINKLWSDENCQKLLAKSPDLQLDVIKLLRSSKGQPEDPRFMPLSNFQDTVEDPTGDDIAQRGEQDEAGYCKALRQDHTDRGNSLPKTRLEI